MIVGNLKPVEEITASIENYKNIFLSFLFDNVMARGLPYKAYSMRRLRRQKIENTSVCIRRCERAQKKSAREK